MQTYFWPNNVEIERVKNGKKATLWAVPSSNPFHYYFEWKKSWVIMQAGKINTIDADRVCLLRKDDEKLLSTYLRIFCDIFFVVCWQFMLYEESTISNRQLTTAQLFKIVHKKYETRLCASMCDAYDIARKFNITPYFGDHLIVIVPNSRDFHWLNLFRFSLKNQQSVDKFL